MDKPIFSIIVPVYKVKEEYLRHCIESVLKQSFSAFELILVDDGSPDHSGEICDQYAQQDSRIHVIHQENQGVSAARNAGIQAASAEWIWFVDADDWIEPNSLSVLHTQVLQTPDIDVLQFRAYLEHNNVSSPITCGVKVDHLYDLNIPEERLSIYQHIMGGATSQSGITSPAHYSWDKLLKRETIVENHLAYPVGIPKSEDKVFFCLCYEKINKLRTISECLYHYRVNNDSVCFSYRPNLDQARLELSKLLLPIAKRMDEELAILFNKPGFHQLYDGYTLFLFTVITDVLLMYFHHKDYPNRKTWRRDAVRFLKTEPFKSAIDDVPYSRLSKIKKVKKTLLKYRCVSTFCRLHIWLSKIRSMIH